MSLEVKMLKRIEDDVRMKLDEIKEAQAKPKKNPQNKLKALKEQLRRLEVVYMAGNKSDDDYIKESIIIKSQIKEEELKAENNHTEEDATHLQAFLDSDFKNTYNDFTQEEKKAFWQGIIKTVHFDGKEIKSVELYF